MSARSARDLRTRSDAAGFRTAWDAALGAGVQRLAEAALSRAIHGVAQPIFYKGEQVGERIRHDERLTAFLLRYHLPHRYGAWRDRIITEQNHPDGRAMILQEAVRRMVADCIADMNDRPRVAHPPLVSESRLDDPAVAAAEADAQARLFQERRRVEWADFERRLSAERAGWEADARRRDGRGSSAGDGSSAPAAEGKSASAAT